MSDIRAGAEGAAAGGDRTDLTQLINNAGSGDTLAQSELFDAIYEELRRIAARYFRQEGAGHTLQTTALVNEMYIKLMGGENAGWKTRPW